MKSFPGDWKLPLNVSGFSTCVLKRKLRYPHDFLIAGTIAICGGNNGQAILNKFFVVGFKGNKQG
jgi:hypothetical protein